MKKNIVNNKVAIFVESRKESGGAFQELKYIIKNIQKFNKNNLDFVIICTSPNLGFSLEDTKYKIHYFSMNALERYICYARNYGPFIRRFKKYLFFRNKFERFLRKINVDLVYFSGPSQYSLYLEDISFVINIHDVAHRENMEFPEISNSSEFQRKDEICSKALIKAVAVITNAEIIKERISFFYGVLKERIYVINLQPSYSIEEFTKIKQSDISNFKKLYKLPQNYIFYPAMYLAHKNHRSVIDALKILRSKFGLDFNIVFCGSDKGYLENLKHYTAKLNLKENVIFLNFIEDKYLPYFYLHSFALVMPALIGPTNIPPWEAFKMEIPVIYSKSRGIKEVLGDAVYYVNPLEPESIANGIKEIFENAELKENLITKGKKKLSEIKAQNEFKQFFEIIKKYRKIKATWEFDN